MPPIWQQIVPCETTWLVKKSDSSWKFCSWLACQRPLRPWASLRQIEYAFSHYTNHKFRQTNLKYQQDNIQVNNVIDVPDIGVSIEWWRPDQEWQIESKRRNMKLFTYSFEESQSSVNRPLLMLNDINVYKFYWRPLFSAIVYLYFIFFFQSSLATRLRRWGCYFITIKFTFFVCSTFFLFYLV